MRGKNAQGERVELKVDRGGRDDPENAETWLQSGRDSRNAARLPQRALPVAATGNGSRATSRSKGSCHSRSRPNSANKAAAAAQAACCAACTALGTAPESAPAAPRPR
ncbi:hypothetical protein AQ611_17845 [Burkholderia singularis]|nr:hypothetical protein AQ611_17845 [Burkholderia sp. Bp7605]